MSDGYDIDASELGTLAADLTKVPHVSQLNVKKAVEQTAIRTKKTWQQDARGKAGRRTKGYPGSIDYDKKEYGGFGQGVFEAEIGPNLSKGGRTGKGGATPSLGILEESNGGVRGPARQSIRVAEKFAEEELEKGVDIAIDQSLKALGL